MADPIATRGISLVYSPAEPSNDAMPEELTLKILSLLNLGSLALAARTCKQLNHMSQDEPLWKFFCTRDFPGRQKKGEETSWKKTYQICAGRDYLSFPFPGKVGIFHVDRDKNWKPHHSITPLLRQICFVNDIEDSICKRLTLFGYKSGSLKLEIMVPSELKKTFKEYLTVIEPASTAITNSREPNCSIYIEDLQFINKIFTAIVTFNTFPKNETAIIKQIILAGDWQLVTPLSENDIEEIGIEAHGHATACQLHWFEWLLVKIFAHDFNFFRP